MAQERRTFILGFDVAQKKDYSALCAIEKVLRGDCYHYKLHGIERLPHGIPYPEQVEHVRRRIRQSPGVENNAVMAIDQTGVGEAVVQIFSRANLHVAIYPILITGGHAITRDDQGTYHVPKKELVAILSVLLESGRLKMAANLPFETVLKSELQNFTAKITTAGNEVFLAWRESQHDDLVLSLALAAWVGENCCTVWNLDSAETRMEDRGEVARAPKGVFEEIGFLDSQNPYRDNSSLEEGDTSGHSFW